jgi:NADH/NAD ratio-sensing transcriptional regulator Rex
MKNNSQQQIAQLTQQIQKSQEVMQQMSTAYQQAQKDLQNVDTIIQENARLKSMMADVSAKAIEVSKAASQENMQMTKELQQLLMMMKKN